MFRGICKKPKKIFFILFRFLFICFLFCILLSLKHRNEIQEPLDVKSEFNNKTNNNNNKNTRKNSNDIISENINNNNNNRNNNNKNTSITNHEATRKIRKAKTSDIILRNKLWQVQYKKNDPEIKNPETDEIAVFSAFHDVRNKRNDVKILAVRRNVKDKVEKFCQVWYEEKEEEETPTQTKAETLVTGRSHKTSKTLVYLQELVVCPLPNLRKPKYVSLTFNEVENSTILLQVQPLATSENNNNNKNDNNKNDNNNNNKRKRRYQFVLCVAEAFGDLNALEIVEWLEGLKLMGVDKVAIYNGSINPNPALNKVISYYTNDGILDYRELNTGALDWDEENKREAFKLSSQAGFNDCMMRYSLLTDWVIVKDFDEFIVPTINNNKNNNNNNNKNDNINKKNSNNTNNNDNKNNNMNNNNNNKNINNNKLITYPELLRILEEDDVRRYQKRLEKNKKLPPYRNVTTYVFGMWYFFSFLGEEPGITAIPLPKTFNNNNNNDQSEYKLFLEKFTNTTGPFPGGGKSWVDPRSCITLFNHYCFISDESVETRGVAVDAKIAKVHHYRKSCPENCGKIQLNSTLTDHNTAAIVVRLKDRLERIFKSIF